jgi:hypothetical protein
MRRASFAGFFRPGQRFARAVSFQHDVIDVDLCEPQAGLDVLALKDGDGFLSVEPQYRVPESALRCRDYAG